MKRIRQFFRNVCFPHALPDYKKGGGDRPAYGYCILKASQLAYNLGYKKMSIIEFGVAGGAGLLSIEDTCRLIQRGLDIEFEIYGFDTGEGLPAPIDYRDEPYKWGEGFYTMDHERARQKLKSSNLVLGNVKDTIKTFFSEYSPAPIGCIIFDLDLYSSTKSALTIFRCKDEFILPRVMCIFDNIGSIEYVGERLAITEFNQEYEFQKIGQNPKIVMNTEMTGNTIFEYHSFQHSDYDKKAELKKVTNLPID